MHLTVAVAELLQEGELQDMIKVTNQEGRWMQQNFRRLLVKNGKLEMLVEPVLVAKKEGKLISIHTVAVVRVSGMLSAITNLALQVGQCMCSSLASLMSSKKANKNDLYLICLPLYLFCLIFVN